MVNRPGKRTRYFGIAGLKLEADEYDLGDGVYLRKTYLHVMAHPVVAAKPAEKGNPHPPPWKSPVHFLFGQPSGWSSDVLAELAIPAGIAGDSVDVTGWIVNLLSIRLDKTIQMSLNSLVPLQEAVAGRAKLTMYSDDGSSPFHTVAPETDITWVTDNWKGSLPLFKDDDVSFAIIALYISHNAHNAEIKIVLVWSALERLFSSKSPELRFRVSATLAAFLEEPGTARWALFKSILNLYDERSRAAHGSELKSHDAAAQSLSLARRALVKVTEMRRMPTSRELEQLLFGTPFAQGRF